MATLSTLQTELLTRLGMGGMTSPPIATLANLTSILGRSQSWLYWQYGWERLRKQFTQPLTSGTQTYAFPAGPPVMEPRRILDATLLNVSVASDLREGVTGSMKAQTTNGIPTRWWRFGTGVVPPVDQFGVWPTPNTTGLSILFDAYQALNSFAVGTDNSTLDDDTILDLSTAIGKYHYGQVDGQVMLALVNQLITRLNAANDVRGIVEALQTAPAALVGPAAQQGREPGQGMVL